MMLYYHRTKSFRILFVVSSHFLQWDSLPRNITMYGNIVYLCLFLFPETAEDRIARYRRTPLSEVSSPGFWMAQNHGDGSPFSNDGYDPFDRPPAESEPWDLDSRNPDSLPRVRERVLQQFRNSLESAVAHSDQEAIWYWESKIDEMSML